MTRCSRRLRGCFDGRVRRMWVARAVRCWSAWSALAGADGGRVRARYGGAQGSAQRAADLGALAGARALHAGYPRLFEPAVLDRVANPRHPEKAAYVALARAAASRVAAANGGGEAAVGSRTGRAMRRCASACRSGGGSRWRGGGSGCGRWRRRSWAQEAGGGFAHGGGYDGPLAVRQGNRCARTWRRRSIAWPRRRPAADGVQLLGTSGFRSDAARAVLFARHPDPKWVAPPGKSLHRYGTELDLGPPPTMAGSRPTRRAPFLKRYEWEYVTFRSGAAMLSRAER